MELQTRWIHVVIDPLILILLALVAFILMGWLEWLPFSPWFAVVPVLAISWAALRLFSFKFTQHRRDRHAGDIANSDSEAPFSLYLRSFEPRDRETDRDTPPATSETGRILGTTDRRLELALVRSVRDSSPMICLGRDQEDSFPAPGRAVSDGHVSEAYLGAGRARVSGSRWQSVVEDCMARATWIFVVPDASPSLSWEIETILSRGHLDKTLFIMPPVFYRENNAQPLRWQMTSEHYNSLGLQLPSYTVEGALFRHRPDYRDPTIRPLPWSGRLLWLEPLPRLKRRSLQRDIYSLMHT